MKRGIQQILVTFFCLLFSKLRGWQKQCNYKTTHFSCIWPTMKFSVGVVADDDNLPKKNALMSQYPKCTLGFSQSPIITLRIHSRVKTEAGLKYIRIKEQSQKNQQWETPPPKRAEHQKAVKPWYFIFIH